MPIQTGAKGVTIGGVNYPPYQYIDWLDSSQEADAVQGGDAFFVPTRRLTAAQVAALQALISSGNATTKASPRFRWVAGDSATAAAVTTASPVQTYADDLLGLADGSVVFVHTGGSLKIEAQSSEDGVAWASLGTLGTGLAAGTYAYRLDTLPRARFLRYVLTATGSTCNVRAFSMWTTAHQRLQTRQVQRGVLGDGTVSIAMIASDVMTSPPIDLRYAVRSQSSLRIVVASGTVKISGQVSRDGINNLISLGDLQTGMTAGAYIIKLDTLAQYGHFLTLTITETAVTTASVSATVSLSLADAFVGTPGRKVAVTVPRKGFEGANWTAAYAAASMPMYSMLERMGYDVELLPLDDASTIFDDGALRYEFCVFPSTNHGGLWTTWSSGSGKPISRLCKGKTAMPFFAVSVFSNNNAVTAANIGAGVNDTANSRKLLWRGATWYAPNTPAFTVIPQAHMNSLEVWRTDAAGGTTGWLYKGELGWVYVSSGLNTSGNNCTLPMMLAEAILRGHIAPPPRKLTAVIDIDDMPASDGGAVGIMTLADMTRVYAAMTRMQMPCSFGIRAEDITAGRQLQAVTDFVSTHTADRGGLIQPIAHNGTWFWKDGDKATKDTAFRADVALITGAGIRVGTNAGQLDAWGYTYANNNAWDEEAHQLGQPGVDYTASTLNTQALAGYGWAVCRLAALGDNNSESIGNPSFVFGQTWYRGILLAPGHNYMASTDKAVAFDDGSTGQTAIANQCARLFSSTLAYGMPYYIHGQNCFDGHDGGDAPGTRWLELMAGVYEAGLSRVVEYVHGSALATTP